MRIRKVGMLVSFGKIISLLTQLVSTHFLKPYLDLIKGSETTKETKTPRKLGNCTIVNFYHVFFLSCK